jgi:ribosomal protein S18 acetylase RimI-like enzyme
MIADLEALNEYLQSPPNLTIERVLDVAALRAYCRVLAVGFGQPSPAAALAWLDWLTAVGLEAGTTLRHFLGRLNGNPVATASLFFGAGVAGIHNVATLPEWRRQGIGSAMTRAALRDARATGHRTATLHASDLGYSIYRRLGFQESCKIGRYMWMD